MQNALDGWDAVVKEGWHIKDEAKEALLEDAQTRHLSVRDLLLATDLRKIGKPFLPEGVNHADSTSLKGSYILQIAAVEDVSKPSKGVGTSTQRLLRLKLTDSKLSCIAAEFKAVPQLSEDLPPGTKVCCTNVSVKLGVLLLDSKSIQVLGGLAQLVETHTFQRMNGVAQTARPLTVEILASATQVLGGQVQELVEAWTFQRKFGTAQRAAAATDDTEQPPAFQSFIPGRRHNQAGHRAPQQQANYPMTDPRAAAAAGRGVPDQASLGTAGKTHQPLPSQPPGGTRAPPGLRPTANGTEAGQLQATTASSSSPAEAEPGTTAGIEAKQPQQQERRPQEAKGQVQHNQAAVKHKLLDRLADEASSGRGRGRGRGRRGRRGHDEDEDTGMTLEEYEALQQRPKPPSTLPSSTHPAEAESQLDQDEALARQLQHQMDMEDHQQYDQQQQQSHHRPPGGFGGENTTPGTDVARDLAQSLFAFDRQEDDGGQYGRGRGRGRGRGVRRGGRGRGRH